MDQLVEFHEAGARVVVYRDGDDLVFWSDFDDNGRSIVTESRLPVADYVAKGEGRWPWYDLGQQRAGALAVLEALGLAPQAWTEPPPADVLSLFDKARDGRASVADLLASGVEVDVLDACGASPLWYAVRSIDDTAALILVDAGADPGRRIEVSARGERFTTILHEMVLLGRVVTLERALARGVDPSLLDSNRATPMHRLGARFDHLNPGIVRALIAAGADVNAAANDDERPIEAAARLILPATVGALLDLGAEPAQALDALLCWWVANVRWAAHRAREVVDVIELLLLGGAVVTERQRGLAAEAGVPSVVAVLDA